MWKVAIAQVTHPPPPSSHSHPSSSSSSSPPSAGEAQPSPGSYSLPSSASSFRSSPLYICSPPFPSPISLLSSIFTFPPASDGIGQPIVETIHCDALCDGQVSADFQINCQINWELDAWLYIDYNSLSPTDNQVMRSLTLLWANPRFVQMLPLAQILLTRQLDASPFDLYIGPLPLSKTTQLDYNWPKNNNYNWPNGFSFCWGAKMSR